MFSKIVEEICHELDIKYTYLSKNWVIALEKDNQVKYLVGNKFDLNGHAIGNVMDDKYSFYDAMKRFNIPVCEHQIMYREDNLNDCIEVECTALDLKNQTFSDLGHIELGKFDNCKDLIYCENPIKKLIVRLYKKITHYENIDWEDDITYYLKSIREK